MGDNSEPYPDGMELWDTATNTITKGLSISSPNKSNHRIYCYILWYLSSGALQIPNFPNRKGHKPLFQLLISLLNCIASAEEATSRLWRLKNETDVEQIFNIANF